MLARQLRIRQILRAPQHHRAKHGLTHVNSEKQPTMVDVSDKAVTVRTAVARSIIRFPASILSGLRLDDAELMSKKGPVLSTATIAGVMGAKKTSDLIPFCHPLALNDCKVSFVVHDDSTIHVECAVKCTGRTGVEMEALTGASIAALCVYDMCKALTHDIVIEETRLLSKTGGKATFQHDASS
ncbi:Aste57867_12899 [Aphanomyces stellatus]|uniref:cyclic pyranopterin monophosphate synthase n=1 Tax=Aphanomyces stellatus TaxID=120398 RepID=A0A485KXG5_9STRA|nr:hypothetical protein As57867_012851 [Aphanomyces stellatus]VFT89746.1 Aste57867_12899 [Aphanomyces stellatus]